MNGDNNMNLNVDTKIFDNMDGSEYELNLTISGLPKKMIYANQANSIGFAIASVLMACGYDVETVRAYPEKIHKDIKNGFVEIKDENIPF